MDYLKEIKSPIVNELNEFVTLFNQSLQHTDGTLSQALEHIRQRGGKRMRPILTLLMAINFGEVSLVTQNAAVGLELLHTASLVHDDVVDESQERRGQASVNASYNNKVAVLVGDYILSTALLRVAYTSNDRIIQSLAELGRTLSKGEILQLNNFIDGGISEEVYYTVIQQKTASLFATCAEIGAISAHASAEEIAAATEFGNAVGMIFQIRDDIFDYYDSKEIGKPTGNDMAEGKLTLPAIYALRHTNDAVMLKIAKKVKNHSVNAEEIARLVAFSKDNGGIDYAVQKMSELHQNAQVFIENHVNKSEIAVSLKAYLDYVIQRNV
ncbi:MAG: polyprenyl synthetase family protein [Prevotella sp.]|nr:polyprenyl synthetase family protein [Prevotella sp.]